MDVQSLVPSDAHDKLKCFICKYYLSYFPIYTCSNGKSLCGRCTPPDDVTYYQDEALETLCQLVKFPCRYHSEGCLDEVVPKDVPQHEQTCRYRQFKCVSTKPEPCNWSGVLPNLLKHCQDKHSNVYLKDGEFELDLTRSTNQDYFLEYEDCLAVFTMRFDCDSKLLLCVLHTNQYQNVVGTSCKLSLSLGRTTVSHELSLTSYQEKTLAELPLQSLCSTENQGPVLGKIGIGGKSDKEGGSVPRSEGNRSFSNVVSALTCNRCHSLAEPPLHRLCSNGMFYIVCSKCKQGDYAGCCKNSKLTSDLCDYSLGTVVNELNCPCPLQTSGCSFSGNYQKMWAHYQRCQFVTVNCVLKPSCPWTGTVRESGDHMLVHHQEMFVPSGCETEMTSADFDTKCKFIKVRQFLFKVSYRAFTEYESGPRMIKKKRKEVFMWSVQSMGDYKDTFKYQIDVSDKERGGRVALWQLCTPLTKAESVFMSPDQYCYLDMDQLCMLKSESKVNVKKEDVVVMGRQNRKTEDVLTITFKIRIYK